MLTTASTEEDEKEETELLDFNKGKEYLPKGNHEWRQQGPYLVCKGCELEHAVWIGMDKLLMGIDKDGNPILEDRDKVFGKV